MSRRTAAALVQLKEHHDRYAHFGQTERADFALMAQLGHPFAKDYRKFRAFFDSLRYASNHRDRYFSFAHLEEHSSFHAPALDLSWTPLEPLRHFGHIYPAREDWEAYIREASRVNWKGAEPGLDTGHWHVTTRSQDLLSALRALANTTTRCRSAESGATIAQVQCKTWKAHRQVERLLREPHRHFVLSKRKPEDTALDAQPTPLARKPFTLGNVKQLTVTDHHVLVPLLPVGPAGQTLALSVVQDLERLFEQGYPLSNAKPWLAETLTATALRELENRQAACA